MAQYSGVKQALPQRSQEQATLIDELLTEIRACQRCAASLPLGPKPVLQASASARILIAGQAPGTRAHASGTPFSDPSGDRLRDWMGVSSAEFYDATRIALAPMGFCYPGRLTKGGDAPPRPECAPLWRRRLLSAMPEVRLTLWVGGYAQVEALGPGSVSARVADFRRRLPHAIALPHPSWRTRAWEARNPWFAAELLPILRARVREELV